MVVIEKSYSRARSVSKKIFTGIAVLFGFFVLLALPSVRIPKFLGGTTSSSNGIAHADFTVSSGDGGGSSGGGGEGCGCDSSGGGCS